MGALQVPFGIGNWAADHVEQAYYNSHAPKKGGPQLKSLPKVGVRHIPTAPTTTPAAHGRPRSRRSSPARFPAKGLAADRPIVQWWRTHTGHDLSSDPTYPQIVAYVAWFDHTRTELGYYPGRYEPPKPPCAVRPWSLTASALGCLRPSMAGSPTSMATTDLRTTARRTSR